MAYTDPRHANPPGMIALVALVHGGLGYALLTGLAGTFADTPDVTLQTYNTPRELPPPDPLPPEPRPKLDRPVDQPIMCRSPARTFRRRPRRSS